MTSRRQRYLSRPSPEEQEQQLQRAEAESEKALSHALHGELNEQGVAFSRSLARRAEDRLPKNAVRARMPEPVGRVETWGGQIATDRDAMYCGCGHLKTGHPTSCKNDNCPCKRVFKETTNG